MIEQLTVKTIADPELLELGSTFFKEFHLPGRFIPDTFIKTWTKLLDLKMGAAWSYRLEGHLVGGIGGIIFPDPNDGQLVAMETFWFTHPSHRSGMASIKLYNTFEKWAIEMQARRIVMASLHNDYMMTLRNLYMRMGFKPLDITYVKELTW